MGLGKFQNGERVCFVGDSITHKGIFIKYIVAYYRKYLPENKVEFYNCGIAGGNLGNTLKIFDEDIAIYDPTHIVLMIGVNDSRFGCLKEPAPKGYETVLAAYERYKRNLEEFYELTKKKGIKLTLCTPVPYAEYIDSEIPATPGGYAVIMGYANYVREFAREKGLELCDYHTAMTKAMQTASLYAPDRVHPNEDGQLVMAKTLLSEQGIELPEEMEIPADIEKWGDTVQRIRNVVAAEFILIPNYLELTAVERAEAIKKRLEDANNGINPPDDYIRSLMHRHIANKPHQKEHMEFIKKFMKEQ